MPSADTPIHSYFATVGKGLEDLVAAELQFVGAQSSKIAQGGVYFHGPLEVGYRACLWSRVANRILLNLVHIPATTAAELYAGVQTIDWAAHFSPQQTFAVDFSGSNAEIRHSRFGAQTCKDAICDQFVAACGTRPDVDITQPDIRVNVYLARDTATVSIDLSGNSLHQRGYRVRSVAAPLKENVAAALLLRARWPEIAAGGGAMLDPMCGSGTLLIEAAWLAGNIAPGSLRTHFGFHAWRLHDETLWEKVRYEALQQQRTDAIPPIAGYDRSAQAVAAARANVVSAGLQAYISVDQQDLSELHAPADVAAGLVATNPPYGTRLGREEDLAPLYRLLGERLKTSFVQWHAAILTNDSELGHAVGIRARRINKLFNGPIECLLLHFDIDARWYHQTPKPLAQTPLSESAHMFANRLKKNRKALARWAEQEQVSCYPVYDADMPEYALAVDLYHGEQLWICAQEYQAPASVDEKDARRRLHDALAAIVQEFNIPDEQLFVKVRKRQKQFAQYEKLGEQGRFHIVPEANCRFYVNFSDYLDTGLFLDHRLTRLRLQQLAKGKRFLNLFAYTATASVHAAMGGAVSTASVDMSNTYLQWAQRNFQLNDLPLPYHRFIQADCLRWLEEEKPSRYDLIFMDPPTFSKSKRMDENLDIQQDHVRLIDGAMRLLAPEGLLVFSTNYRKFKLDTELSGRYGVLDISAATIPTDFARNPKIHYCFEIRHRG